ncbi:HAF repeat-containing protein [Massilia sp. CMS3.1]|uniref:HAF repeat-containing protein n=1 Tax=Massilia sp. CMS3.1 TaxID=3373083 RepID=UPI003EE6183D
MSTRKCFAAILLTCAFSLANAAWAYPEYRVTVVGPVNSAATDINSSGAVVGTYPFSPTSIHGFLNRGKGLVDLSTLGGRSSNAVAINDKGEVLGNWTTNGGQQRGFIYAYGRQRDIGIVPGRFTTYTDINNAGYVTAIGAAAGLDGSRSFLRSPTGNFTEIGKLPFEEPTLTHALALNNRNQIAGESGPLTFPDQPLRAFIWNKGVIRDLGDLGDTPNGGTAINDRGQVTGFAALQTGFRDRAAFVYSNGRLVDIDRRPVTEDRDSAGTGINNCGDVVGTSNHLSGFIYRGKRMQSLNALIDPKLGWDISAPQAINDAGQIAATAFRNGVQYAVRLDLIRPSAVTAPAVELDAEIAAASAVSPAVAAANATAHAEAQAREVARPVKQ